MDKDCSLKKKIFNIIQIGDKSNRISRAFDIFITITIVLNILVTFAQTFDELSRITMGLKAIEYVTLGIFCVEYVLRIWTAEYLYPNIGRRQAKLRFLISFDGVIDLLTIVPVFFLSGFVIFRMLRVARIFHLFRLNAKYDSFNVITTVLYEKRNQIISSVFIVLILMLASSLSNLKNADIKQIAEIFVDKRYAGKSIEEVEEQEQLTIFLILREDLSILPQKDTLLKQGDIIIIRAEGEKE